MKPVESKDLIVGKVYRDTIEKDENSSYLRFLEYDEYGDLKVEFVGGFYSYLESQRGYIPLYKEHFLYELEPNESYD